MCIRNEAHSEHINRKGWFSFSPKCRRNGLDSELYKANAKDCSGSREKMKLQYLFAFPQRSKQNLTIVTSEQPGTPPFALVMFYNLCGVCLCLWNISCTERSYSREECANIIVTKTTLNRRPGISEEIPYTICKNWNCHWILKQTKQTS